MEAKVKNRLKRTKILCWINYLTLGNIKFAVKNKRFWKRYLSSRPKDKRAVVLTEVSNNVFLAMGTAILANVIAKAKKATVLYLAYDGTQHAKLKWLRASFSKSYYESVCEIAGQHTKEITAEVQGLYATLEKPSDILELKYKGLMIGDLVYDISMRIRNWQATVWSVDERIYETLEKVINLLFVLEYISNKYHVKAVSYSHMVGLGGAVMRYFASRGVECCCGVAGGSVRKYFSFDGKSLKCRNMISKVWLDDVMRDDETKKLLLSKADKYIIDRTSGNSDDWSSRRAFAKDAKKYTGKDEFCRAYGLSSNKPCVFVMLHAFNDFPHHFEKGIFIDYYRWFVETLKIARNTDDVNWIFKEHPVSEFYPNDANLNGIFEVCNEPHILFLDRNCSFNPSSLRYISYAIVTCLGTAGLEFSCFGIPAVIAADNHYSGFGICYEPQTYEDYRELLENITSSVKPLDSEIQERAKILFYLQHAVIYGKNVNNKSFFGMTTIPHDRKIKNDINDIMPIITEHLEDPETVEFLTRIEKFISNQNKECFYVNEYLDSKLGWKVASYKAESCDDRKKQIETLTHLTG